MKKLEEFLKTSVGKFIAIIVVIIILHNFFSPYKECMRNLAKKATDSGKLVIADFVCPTPETRKDFGADLLIWIDTIKSGRFNDTNQMFIPPEQFFFRVTTKDAEYWVQEILKKLKDFK